MIRNTLMAVSALAAAALAAPAFADPVVVHLAGKSPAASYRMVAKAAHAACRLDRGSEIYAVYLADDCEKNTIAAALAKIGDPALSKYAADREALLLTLAAN